MNNFNNNRDNTRGNNTQDGNFGRSNTAVMDREETRNEDQKNRNNNQGGSNNQNRQEGNRNEKRNSEDDKSESA